MRKNKLLLLLALLMTAATGARAAWTGGTYTATATENLGAITVNGDATLTINSDVTVTITGGINVASGTLTVTGPGTLVVNGAKGNNGASGWEGSNGSNGGVAISGNIIVQGGATVTATGGTGGTGGTGAFVGGNGGNGGVAFAGTLTYKSGTVTAIGGSAGSGGYIDDEERYASSGSAGKAFANDVDFTQTTGYSVTNGTSTIGSVLNQTKVVISGGTDPAAAPAGYTVSLKSGVKDADKWTVKVGEGQAQALPIGGLKGDGKETVTLQYTGRLKVKGVKATSDAPAAKEPATVTTAPTGAAIVGVGKTTALVSGGAAEGGTMMYKVTTENTKPASTDGFSDAVPTAEGITASGKVYVWYYVKGDDTHTDSEIAATAIEVTVADVVDLSTLTENTELKDGNLVTGTLAGNYKITIADGATVTLDGAVINGTNSSNWAGLTLAGDGTIILSGVNSVKGFYEDYPGIFVPANKTLTIQGDGSLNVSSNGFGAGIGGGYEKIACGNITIEGGTINAQGGTDAAGIGGGWSASCGNISITGGTVTATGGKFAAGIGSGSSGSSCGNITITDGVTKVTATAGQSAPNSIGAGWNGSCGTVTIGGNTGAISESPYTYQPSN